VEKSASDEKCDTGRAFVGILILGVGVIFLLSNWGIIPSMHRTWPLILIVVGLAFLFGAGRKHKVSSQQSPKDEGPGTQI
jgi:protein-S-isoprenylcysteine O-methyltransferase Ste14